LCKKLEIIAMGNRTVFDTNIWVSSVISGKFYELLAMSFKNNVTFLPSIPSIAELKEVLSRKKFAKYDFDFEEIISLYTDISEFCETKPVFKDCPDPKDNFLFDLAIQGNADYLVSGDTKVLETPLKNETIKVINLTAFKEKIK